MSKNALVMAAVLLSACRPGPKVVVDPSPTSLDPVRLTEVLQLQFEGLTAAWNRGDLDTFMAVYADDATYVDGYRPQRGNAWIRSRYEAMFARGAKRDSLALQEFTARPLSPTMALVTARYVLYQGSDTTARGPFTVVMEERTDGWKILHDHSSSDPR
jgi:uncharacterized protein (TIGR02246 family)